MRVSLRLSAASAVSAVSAATKLTPAPGAVVGYTTSKVLTAGCPGSLRVRLDSPVPNSRDVFAGVLRTPGHGYLPAICCPHGGGFVPDLEVVLLGKPDDKHTSVCAVPEAELRHTFPAETVVELAMLRVLLPFQPSCPVEWLMERFEHLSDSFEAQFGPVRETPWASSMLSATSKEETESLKSILEGAGLSE